MVVREYGIWGCKSDGYAQPERVNLDSVPYFLIITSGCVHIGWRLSYSSMEEHWMIPRTITRMTPEVIGSNPIMRDFLDSTAGLSKTNPYAQNHTL